MAERIRVGIADLKISQAPDILVAYGLGSCLGISIYDHVGKVGGLVHVLLPSARYGAESIQPGKFVETAVPQMVARLLAAGASVDHMVAKIAGGAQMFDLTPGVPGGGIGQRNIEMAHSILSDVGIPLAGEAVGGNFGRTMELDLSSGEITVRFLRNNERGTEVF